MTRGRPRCFDEQEALNAAMQVFWEKGFAGASCDDLLSAMKMKPGSMYAAFGDKESLYAKALKQYTQNRFGKLLGILESDVPPLDRIRNLMDAVGKHMSCQDSKGCFVINTLIENEEESPQTVMARQSMTELQTAIQKNLQDAKDNGQLNSKMKPADLAALFISTLQGINVMGRSRMSEASIKGAVKSALSLLD